MRQNGFAPDFKEGLWDLAGDGKDPRAFARGQDQSFGRVQKSHRAVRLMTVPRMKSMDLRRPSSRAVLGFHPRASAREMSARVASDSPGKSGLNSGLSPV